MGRAVWLLFSFAPLIGSCAFAQIESSPIEQAVKAVGRVLSMNGKAGDISGSGVVISADGLVVTCQHVIGDAGKSGRIAFSEIDPKNAFLPLGVKSMLRLERIRSMPEYDLALLKIAGYADGRPLEKGRVFRSVTVGRSERLTLLERVYIIGFPKVGGETVTVIEGRVAGKDTANQWVKVDASISRGFSGGAVVNSRGELVGIPTELRVDVDDSSSDSSSESRLVYGTLAWVRPPELVMALMAPPRDVDVASSQKSKDVGVIHGRVMSSSGEPLDGAVVGLLQFGSRLATADNLVTYARTTSDGSFVIRTAPGKYTLRINCAGYRASLQTVEVKTSATVSVSLAQTEERREQVRPPQQP